MRISVTPILIFCWILFMNMDCDPDNYRFEYDMAVGETPANLNRLNTEYDDYNSDLPFDYKGLTLTYSTNRASTGGQFDFRSVGLSVTYHERDGLVNITFSTNPDKGSYPEMRTYETAILRVVTTLSDELGPASYRNIDGWDYFLYSNNESGHFQIKMVYNSSTEYSPFVDGIEGLNGPFTLSLNSGQEDNLYPALSKDGSTMFFCSNRSGEFFDIYAMEMDSSRLIHEVLLDEETVPEVSVMEELSSEGNDKCPSVTGDLLVFTSDREGGMGGFDLYYSVREEDHWGEPVNFGPEINTSADEYRPITFVVGAMGVMIFSSNRPGGAGGFDLYAVQIPDLSSHLYDGWYMYY